MHVCMWYIGIGVGMGMGIGIGVSIGVGIGVGYRYSYRYRHRHKCRDSYGYFSSLGFAGGPFYKGAMLYLGLKQGP